jgi:hypothetical protein
LKAPIVLVWDNLSTHKVPQLQEFITAHADWLTVFHLASAENLIRPGHGHLDHPGVSRPVPLRILLAGRIGGLPQALGEDDRLCCFDWPTSA